MGIAEEGTSEFHVYRRASVEVIRKSGRQLDRTPQRNAALRSRFAVGTSPVLSQHRAPHLHGTRHFYLPCVSLDEIRFLTSSHGTAFTLPESMS